MRERGLPLVLIVAGVAAACSRGERAAPMPSVLLVTLDTTRADRLGCYGHAQAQTRNLDALAARGARLARAYAPVPLTLPSHATLLTGTLPPEHGLHDNGRAGLGPELSTLAEMFGEHGYSTGAFVSCLVLGHAFGLGRGFDVYDDHVSSTGGTTRDARAVTDAVLTWLEKAPRPFFCWLHYYDPHSVYEPPSPYRERLADPYDGEIAYVDAELGRVLDWLGDRGPGDDTLVLVTADHGESLGEHGERTHGVLPYEATQRVPMIVALPGRIEAGLVVDAPVQLADVLPTLAELLDWKAPGTASGTSFARELVSGAQHAERPPAYVESEYSRLNFGWSSIRGVTFDGWTYLHSSDPELYDLERDPREEVNRVGDDPARAASMHAQLERLLADLPRRGVQRVTASPGTLAAMEGLGYAQGRAADDPAADHYSGPSPRDGIDALERYHRAVSLRHQGDFAGMAKELEQVVEAYPDGVAFLTALGIAYRMTDRLAEARATLEHAVEQDPDYDHAHRELAEVLLRVGEPVLALQHFLRAAALNPSDVVSREKAAALLVQRGEVETALGVYRELVALEPERADRRFALSYLLRSTGRSVEMLEAIEEAHRLAPDDAAITSYLAWELATNPSAEVRDGARAVRLAEALCNAEGKSFAPHLDTLAAAYAEAGRFEDAVKAANDALALARRDADAVLEQAIEARLREYERGEPHREKSP